MTFIPVPMHPLRRYRATKLAQRDPEVDWEDIYRQVVLWEFPIEARSGFQVAFYRPQAVPRMAAVLAGTGHIKADPGRRTLDTGIVILELIHGGFDSGRGQKMIRLLRALHDRPDIYQEDMTYVLNSLIVVPVRFIEKVGWRSLSETERTAAWRWWNELGDRIGVNDLSPSYDVAAQQFDAYETENLAASDHGRQLTEMILTAFAGWVPRPLASHVGEITSALIDDPRFSEALGLPPARFRTEKALDLLYGVRRLRQRLSPPPLRPSFKPGQKVARVYPSGYDIDKVGPLR